MDVPRTIEWIGNLEGHVRLIDQTLLPERLEFLEINDVESMWAAIKRLSVRGAPAIGIAAAMGVVLGIREYQGIDRAGFLSTLDKTCDYLATSRPTAVNLFWALKQMKERLNDIPSASVIQLKWELLAEAKHIRDEDAELCHGIGRAGHHLISEGSGVMTHCNAGGLATAEYGTALAVMFEAHQHGRKFRVYANETRPLLQGARLTSWELQQAGIDVRLLCDNMAGATMKAGKVQLVVVGADRIAANGDTANKIGTYSVAVLAHAHNIPFYVAAPSSTFDLATPNGDAIPIEYRDADEIRRGMGRLTAPPDVPCESPAFDVTPAALIRGIITEQGIISPVTEAAIRRHLTI